MKPIDITDEHRDMYHTLLHAAKAGRLGLLSAVEKGTGKPVMVLVAKNPKEDGGFDLVPLGTIFTSDPTEFLETPDGFCVQTAKDDNDLGETTTLTE